LGCDIVMVQKPALPTIVLLFLVCLYALVFGVLAARAYPAHETGAFDLGVYDQPLWNAAQGRSLSLTLVPHLGPTRFAIHVEPILFLFVPIYRFVTDDPRVLLWLQAVVIALGGLPLYGLARRRIANDWAALAIVAAYFLLPALESVNLFDFHAVGLAPTLLLTALYFLDLALITTDDPRGLWTGMIKYQTSNHKYQMSNHNHQMPGRKIYRLGRLSVRSQTLYAGLSGLFFLLALSTKEDISLHVFMIGLFVLILRRRWRPGLALIIVGLVWFFLAFYVIVPSSRPSEAGSAYVDFFDSLGDTPLEIALSPIHTPGKVLGLLVTPENIRALTMLTLPLAFLPLVGLPIFILATPTLAITLLSNNPLMHQLETYHYAAPAIPFIILAAVDGIARLSNVKSGNQGIRESGNQQVVDRSQLAIALSLSLLVLIVSLVYHYYRGYSPLARPFHWPVVTAHEQQGDELAASIPRSAPVVAQAELVTLASHRQWIQIWQGPLDEQADYFLWDVSHPAFVNRNGAQEKLLSDIARDPTVGPIVTQDGYILLQRDAPRSPTTPEFLTYIYADPPSGATPVSATFGDTLQLVAFETHRNYADREAEPLITLYWRVLSPMEEDYFIAIFLLDEAGEAAGVTPDQQPLTVWWPTSRWEPGRTVRLLANTFPWWTGDRQRFSYGVAVVHNDEPTSASSAELWNVTNRLPVIREDGRPAPLDDGTLLPLVDFKRVMGIPYEIKAEVEAETGDGR
jgi:uncharacterized membrane protein